MAAGLTFPYELANGATADADEVMSNFNQIKNNLNPDTIEDASANLTAMQSIADPYPGSSESLPDDLRGEIKRLRYQLDAIIGKTNWYEDPDIDLATLAPLGGVSPSFSVHRNGTIQTIPAATYTKIRWTTKEFDTNFNFIRDEDDSGGTTESRFTPTVAGKYLLTASLRFLIASSGDIISIHLYKNGALFKNAIQEAAGNFDRTISITAIVDANGSGDYFEIYGFNASNNDSVSGLIESTFFAGSRMI